MKKPNPWEYPDLGHPSMKDVALVLPINDKGDKIHDQSGRRNNGTNNGATWTSGPYGPALSFDGSSSIELPDKFENITDADFTITINFRLTTDSFDQALFSTSNSTLNEYACVIFFDRSSFLGGTNVISALITASTPALDWLWIESSTLSLNTDYTVTFVYEKGVTANLYVNGVLDNADSQNLTLSGVSNSNEGARLGYSLNSAGLAYRGLMDSVVIWEGTRTAQQVKQQFDFPWQAWEKDNIALWAASQAVTGNANLLDGPFERYRRIA